VGGILSPSANFVEVRKLAKQIERRLLLSSPYLLPLPFHEGFSERFLDFYIAVPSVFPIYGNGNIH